MIRRIAILLPALCVVTLLHAQKSMTLEDCVQYALAHHPEVTLAQLDLRDADWQIKENGSVALPQFTAGVSYQYFLKQPSIPAEAFGFEADPGTKLSFALKNNLTGTVAVNQLLFSNSYLLGVKGAREYRKYVDLKFEAVKAHLRNAVTDAYLPALLLEENIIILGRNIEVQQKLLRETGEVFKAGFAEQLDVDRLQFILASLINQRDNFLRQRDITIDVLQFAMFMPVNEEITLSDDLAQLLETYSSINPEEQLNYMNRPDYVTVLKTQELGEIQIDLYEKPWLPTLAGFAQYQPSYQGNEKLFWIPSAIVGVQMNVPIYDGGLTKSRKERAIVSAEKVDVQKEMLERAYDLEIETARKQYANARAQVQNQEENLQLAQRIYDTSETKFQSGIGSSVEVTQAQAGLYQTQALFVQAKFELLQARVALKKALGK